MRIIIAIFVAALVSINTYASVSSPGSYYASTDNLNVRLSPDSSGKVTNRLSKGSKVDVLSVENGWARISKYYDGSLEGVKGEVARWVSTKYLSTENPESRVSVNTNSLVATAIKGSDDFSKYSGVFIVTSEQLIATGRCTIGDFKEIGGWWKSSSHKPKPVYFTYCGRMHKSNKLYLNASTGEVFR
ncbi:MAG: hypothetical protein ACI9NT_000706 [Bacteroidia bacterium]|jgi:hypothetical protein